MAAQRGHFRLIGREDHLFASLSKDYFAPNTPCVNYTTALDATKINYTTDHQRMQQHRFHRDFSASKPRRESRAARRKTPAKGADRCMAGPPLPIPQPRGPSSLRPVHWYGRAEAEQGTWRKILLSVMRWRWRLLLLGGALLCLSIGALLLLNTACMTGAIQAQLSWRIAKIELFQKSIMKS